MKLIGEYFSPVTCIPKKSATMSRRIHFTREISKIHVHLGEKYLFIVYLVNVV
jgi:hypothetical protein